MARKTADNASYKALCADIAAGKPGTQYVFTGEERYLLEYSVRALRACLLPSGTEDFNYRRFEGKGLSVRDIGEAVDAVPLFAERTLVEVWDYAFQERGEEEKTALAEILRQLPDYVCLVFVCETAEFKLDGRAKADGELKKLLNVVTFNLQEQSELAKWVRKRFRALDKAISAGDAEYLCFLAGGEMTALVTEVEKISAYARTPEISRADIDAVTVPAAETEAYKLSDALIRGSAREAARLLGILFQMRTDAHRILFWIARDFRWLLTARLCVEEKKGAAALTELCGIRYSFQAENMIRSARRKTTAWCRDALIACCEAAYALNDSGGSGEDVLKDLLLKLEA